MEAMWRVVMVACSALLFVPVSMKSRTSQEIPVRTAFSALSSNRIAVKLSGDLKHPGIYMVSANLMADTVIKMAEPLGPIKQGAAAIGAAQPLQNGTVLELVLQVDGSHVVTRKQMTVPERLVLKIPLDISLMNEADFDRLPGIGHAVAKRISEYRHNNGGILRVEDLAAVEGIGEKKYKMLRCFF